MGTLIIVDGDKVEGTDTHNVSGPGIVKEGGAPATYIGTASYEYKGKMTEDLSDFVAVDSNFVALKSSKSSLNPGEDIPVSGGHSGPMGSNFSPDATTPIVATTPVLLITEPVGVGNPSSGSGSSFVKIGGVEALLDGDSIDTCDGTSATENSNVTAETQDFVSCSE